MKKAGIGIGIGVVVLGLLAWFAIVAAGVAGEASQVDQVLKDSMNQHMMQAQLSQKLSSMGFKMTDGPEKSTGDGPTHSMLIYSTHLTVQLTFDADGKNTGYHLDRV